MNRVGMLPMRRQKGFTLLELLVAILLLGMISTMIYSMMSVGIRSSERGEKRLLTMDRKMGLLTLMRRQVASAWYDPLVQRVMISADDSILRIHTRTPLVNRHAGLVLAVYRYNPDESTVYYLEKKDFFNGEYGDNYIPGFEEMIPLIKTDVGIAMEYDPDTGAVAVDYGGRYVLYPRCMNRESVF